MAPKFSLAYLSVLGVNPMQQTYMAARAGYDFVSIRPIHLGLPGEPDYDIARQPELRMALKRALDSTGIGIHDIELARVGENDPEQYRDVFEVAASLGARSVISSIWITDKAEYIDKFAHICSMAADYGLTVGLEYVPIAEVNTLPKAVEVLRAVDAPNAGLMLDMYHVDRCGTRPEDLDSLPREWFTFAHICDAPATAPVLTCDVRDELRERRLYCGEGGLRIADFLNRLPEMVYSIELPHKGRWENLGAAEHAWRCLETAKAYFEANVHPVGAAPSGLVSSTGVPPTLTALAG